MYKDLENRIFELTQNDFETLALEVFRYQAEHNTLYKSYVDILKKDIEQITALHQIPFLPVSFFKTQDVICGNETPDFYFESSGTTGMVNSKHFIKDLSIYKKSFQESISLFYGDISDWCILGLLPSYLERKHSSLVYMTEQLIQESSDKRSGFFLHNHDELNEVLIDTEKSGTKTLLIGVTYALLDFAESFSLQLKNTIVMETGGMKGRKKEMTRYEVHEILKKRLGIAEVHSEYGMTELLSQAYALKDGIFKTPPWMKIFARVEDDPFQIYPPSDKLINGVANIIDLANLYSCSFIATDDMVRLHPNGNFEIYGRLDNSDIRGCSLLSVN